MRGEMSTGVLVASSILVSRMLAPLSSVTGVLNRWQQARMASDGLDQLMRLPVDHAEDGSRIHRPVIEGRYDFSDAVFSYDGKTPRFRSGNCRSRPVSASPSWGATARASRRCCRLCRV